MTWLAPMLCFTAEEAWLARYPRRPARCICETFPEVPARWRDEALAEKWRKIRNVRRVVTGALEDRARAKAHRLVAGGAPIVHVADPELFAALVDIDLAEICITSAATLVEGEGPADAFRLADVPGVAVVPNRARGHQMRALVEDFTTRRLRSGISRRHAARRAGVARMGRHAQGGGIERDVPSAARSRRRPPSPRRSLIARSGEPSSWLLQVIDLAPGVAIPRHAVLRPRRWPGTRGISYGCSSRKRARASAARVQARRGRLFVVWLGRTGSGWSRSRSG